MKKSNNDQLKVLIADSKFIIGFDLTQQLVKNGYEVHYKSDIEEVKQFIDKTAPDFIIAEAPTLKAVMGERIKVFAEDGGLVIVDGRQEKIAFCENLVSADVVKRLNDYLMSYND